MFQAYMDSARAMRGDLRRCSCRVGTRRRVEEVNRMMRAPESKGGKQKQGGEQ
jgi:hypothetical protein